MLAKSTPYDSLDPLDAFQKGYLVGKAEAYCEQIRTGAKLVGAFGFDRRYIRLVRKTVKTEGCKLIVNEAYGRATAYVYRYPFAKLLIKNMLRFSGKASATTIWTTGKVFGYSDYEIARYLEQHRVKIAL
jgi:hypothetical protein